MAIKMSQEFLTVSLDITQISVDVKIRFFLWLMIEIHTPEHDKLMLTPEHDKLMLMHTQVFILFFNVHSERHKNND